MRMKGEEYCQTAPALQNRGPLKEANAAQPFAAFKYLNAEHVDEFLNSRRALLKRDALLRGQVDLDDLFEAARAELAGHADVEVLYAVLAFEVSGARQNLLLVFQN